MTTTRRSLLGYPVNLVVAGRRCVVVGAGRIGARKVDGLREVLETRTQLSNLLTYMDGKGNAQKRIQQLLNDRALLQSLASAPKSE